MATDEVNSSSQERVQTDRTAVLDLDLDELLRKSAEQNQFAFRELYGRTSGNLFAVQCRILNDKDLAEDALKESYVKIWNSASLYQSNLGSPLTWMIGIARSEALNTLRARELTNNGFIPDTDIFNGDNVDFGAQSPLDLLADSTALRLCFSRLEENPRICVIKAYCNGWSHAQLSAQLGSPMDTVKSWIRHGLITLRECLQ